MICEGLQTLLLAQSSVTNVVGTAGVFVSAAKQSASPPYVILDRVSDEKHGALDGYVSTSRHCEVDIYCYDTTPQDAAALAKIISDYLDDFSGATGGSETILSSHQIDDYDTFDEPEDGGEISNWVTILNFEFQYTE